MFDDASKHVLCCLICEFKATQCLKLYNLTLNFYIAIIILKNINYCKLKTNDKL